MASRAVLLSLGLTLAVSGSPAAAGSSAPTPVPSLAELQEQLGRGALDLAETGIARRLADSAGDTPSLLATLDLLAERVRRCPSPWKTAARLKAAGFGGDGLAPDTRTALRLRIDLELAPESARTRLETLAQEDALGIFGRLALRHLGPEARSRVLARQLVSEPGLAPGEQLERALELHDDLADLGRSREAVPFLVAAGRSAASLLIGDPERAAGLATRLALALAQEPDSTRIEARLSELGPSPASRLLGLEVRFRLQGRDRVLPELAGLASKVPEEPGSGLAGALLDLAVAAGDPALAERMARVALAPVRLADPGALRLAARHPAHLPLDADPSDLPLPALVPVAREALRRGRPELAAALARELARRDPTRTLPALDLIHRAGRSAEAWKALAETPEVAAGAAEALELAARWQAAGSGAGAGGEALDRLLSLLPHLLPAPASAPGLDLVTALRAAGDPERAAKLAARLTGLGARLASESPGAPASRRHGELDGVPVLDPLFGPLVGLHLAGPEAAEVRSRLFARLSSEASPGARARLLEILEADAEALGDSLAALGHALARLELQPSDPELRLRAMTRVADLVEHRHLLVAWAAKTENRPVLAPALAELWIAAGRAHRGVWPLELARRRLPGDPSIAAALGRRLQETQGDLAAWPHLEAALQARHYQASPELRVPVLLALARMGRRSQLEILVRSWLRASDRPAELGIELQAIRSSLPPSPPSPDPVALSPAPGSDRAAAAPVRGHPVGD